MWHWYTLGLALHWLLKQQRNKYMPIRHLYVVDVSKLLKNSPWYSFAMACSRSNFRAQSSIFYNYSGLWSCHHHVKTAKKLECGFLILQKKSLLRKMSPFIFQLKQCGHCGTDLQFFWWLNLYSANYRWEWTCRMNIQILCKLNIFHCLISTFLNLQLGCINYSFEHCDWRNRSLHILCIKTSL